MKKVKSFRLVIVIALLALGVFIGAQNIYAKDMVGYFDDMFADGEYTIYTDFDITSDSMLTYFLNLNGLYIQEYYNSGDDWSSLSVNVNNCSLENMICNFDLYRNGPSFYEKVKSYEGVRLSIDSDVSSSFPMMNGDDISINYDESMFSSDEEKQDYINIYLGGYNSYDGSNSANYRYDSFRSDCKAIYKEEYVDGVLKRRLTKKVDNVIFNYVEEPYSDDFKRLTSGTLTVKSDAEINSDLLGRYIRQYGSFWLDGNMSGDKAMIKMSSYADGQQTTERHLVTIVRDSNIDLSVFSRIGYGEYIDIQADGSLSSREYITNYFNMTYYDSNNDDGSHEYYDDGTDNYDSNYGVVVYSKKNNNFDVVDAQIHRAPIRFTGYNDTISDYYRDNIGDTITVRADQLDINTINNTFVGIYANVLGCNNDYSMCDVMLENVEDRTLEIHKVNIVLDNTVSDAFKEAFNIKMDGSIDIIADDGIDINWMSYYYYDEGSENNLRFEYDGSQLKLYLTNYLQKVTESHTVDFNVVGSDPSASYQANIKSSIEVYPGENQDIWTSIRNSTHRLFSKNGDNNYNINSISCDSANRKCFVAYFNADRVFEVHGSSVTLKDGTSPEYNSLIPDGRMSLNAVYEDDGANYIFDASRAYFLSKTKKNAYISRYRGDSALVTLDDVESHTVGIDYAQGNPEHKAIVDDAIARLGSNLMTFSLDDLEYVNTFYYRDPNYGGIINYNSKTINDALMEKVGNKHISFYLASACGGGDRFMDEEGSRILLYYDGIAYGETRSDTYSYMHHVIYVPDETADTADAFVAAAQKRIDDYFGKDSGVKISFVDRLEYDAANFFEQGFDLTGFDGNYYQISYMDKTEEVLILKNSSKIQTSTFNANDASSNVNVSSDNANYPTDTVVSADTVNENSNKYKELLKKLGLTIAQIVDISLYSPTIGNINDFTGVDFDVTVPIDWSKFKGRNLFAYYVADNGSVEEHPITIDDFLAKFKTNHFSTYVISEKIDSSIIDGGGSSASGDGSSASNGNNPKTFDDVMIWVAACAICAIGLASASLYLKKIKKQK